MELWKKAALDYNTDVSNHNYFTDVIEIHSILGLTVTYGKAVAFANLVRLLSAFLSEQNRTEVNG